MIYTDGIHLVADSLPELHRFAQKIGLKPEWFQNHRRHPHYDLFNVMVTRALFRGAMPVGSRDLVRLTHKMKGK